MIAVAMRIVISDVSKELHDAIVARAALHRQSLEEYSCSSMEQVVTKPPTDEWLERVEASVEAFGTQVPTSVIFGHGDTGRK